MFEHQFAYVARRARDDRAASGSPPSTPAPRSQERFIAEVDRKMAGTVWMKGGCQSWYVDRHGRNSTLWPDWTLRARAPDRALRPRRVRDDRGRRGRGARAGSPPSRRRRPASRRACDPRSRWPSSSRASARRAAEADRREPQQEPTFPVGRYASGFRGFMRGRPRVRLIGEVTGLRLSRQGRLLRAPRRRRRPALLDVARRLGPDEASRGSGPRRHRGRRPRRPRLLPGQRDRLAVLLVPLHRAAARRGGRPARSSSPPCGASSPTRGCSSRRRGCRARPCRGRSGSSPAAAPPPRPTCSPASPAAPGRDAPSSPTRRSRTATPRRGSPAPSPTSPAIERGRGDPDRPRRRLASPTSGPSATRPSAAPSRCCASR